MLAATDTPVLWRRARLSHDDVRNRPVLLYPEGAVLLNDTGAAILSLCDGTRTVAQIATELSGRYGGAPVQDDVTAFLDALADKELVLRG